MRNTRSTRAADSEEPPAKRGKADVATGQASPSRKRTRASGQEAQSATPSTKHSSASGKNKGKSKGQDNTAEAKAKKANEKKEAERKAALAAEKQAAREEAARQEARAARAQELAAMREEEINKEWELEFPLYETVQPGHVSLSRLCLLCCSSVSAASCHNPS